MNQDLMKSLTELDEMLKGIQKGDTSDMPEIMEPIADPKEAKKEENTEEVDTSPYSIKNGAYVRVADDGMTAWVYLNPPKDGKYYTKFEIIKFLQENKVMKGYHHSNLSAIAKKHVYEREIVAARGQDPIKGVNGYYEFFFDTSDKRKPEIREDGTVDYTSMSRLTNVNKGDKIAIYHKAVESQNGFDVFGRALPAKQSRELPPLRGRGFECSADGCVYTAAMDGRIDFKNNTIDIKNVYEVSGDVDMVTGKIEFFGDIHIKGNVEEGVVVRANRNITIDGVVAGATIYAGGDVILNRGIQGGQKGSVIAKGDISAEFIELATVQAGGNVRSNSYINANVYAGDHVIAEGQNGVIIGGEVRGLLGVTAQTIGNDVETKTFVGAGYSSDDYRKYIDINQKEQEIQKLLSATVDEMTKILKDRRLGNEKNSEATDKILMGLNDKKDEFFEILDKIRTVKEELVKLIDNGKGAVILANEKIYRGVTISVEGGLYHVPANTGFMRYTAEGGKVIPSVIVVN